MNGVCREFRDAWVTGERGSAHPAACPACGDWVRATERMLAELSRLTPVRAPEVLASRIAAELAGDRSGRLVRNLCSVVRRSAPEALDGIVAERIERMGPPGDSERRKALAVGTLDLQRAPDVLDRLVHEELEAPERHRAERFTGSLPRLEAPAELGELVRVRVRRRVVSRHALLPLLALAAAGVALWFSLTDRGTEIPTRRLRVVHSATLDGIDPRALALAESIGGGFGSDGEVR